MSMSLYISTKTPSPDLDKSPIDEAITSLATHIAVEKRNGHLPDGPALDITFMLSTADDAPPFSGMRMGGYTDENQTLYFEAAVPVQMAQSEVAPFYVASVLQDAVDNAREYFESAEVAFDGDKWTRAIAPIVELDSKKVTTH
jgi:hypothetical protein